VVQVSDRASGVRETPTGGRCRRTQLTVNGKTVQGPRCTWLRRHDLRVVYQPEGGWQPGKAYAWSLTASDRAGHAVSKGDSVVAVARTRRPVEPPATRPPRK
jgi:hypothetical protein